MSILEDLDDARPNPLGLECGVAHALKAHPDLADEIAEAVMRRDRPAKLIADVLSRHGVSVTHGTIARHRRGECRCHS